MPIWKQQEFAENDWQTVADDAPLPADAPALVSLTRWRAEKDALAGRNAAIGLVIQPGEDWDDIVDDLSRFPVIAVAFPKFADGRAFSIARRLRDRDGYAGEIRAVGDYFLDQMPFMSRVGIDAFQVDDPILQEQLKRGDWPEVPHYLQPVDEDGEVPVGTRPWARMRAG